MSSVSKVSQHRTSLEINVGDYEGSAGGVLVLNYVKADGSIEETAHLTPANIDDELYNLVLEISSSGDPELVAAEKNYKYELIGNHIAKIWLLDIVCVNWLSWICLSDAPSVRYFMALPATDDNFDPQMTSWVNQWGFHPKPILHAGATGGVESVTGEGVNNADPLNPVISQGNTLMIATTTLSAADILAFPTPKVIVAGQVNKVIVPISSLFQFINGGVNYAAGGVVGLEEEFTGTILITNTNVTEVRGPSFIKQSYPLNNLLRSAGRAVQLNSITIGQPAFTTGNGTIVYTLFYRLVTV